MKQTAKQLLRSIGAYDFVRSQLVNWHNKKNEQRAVRREIGRRHEWPARELGKTARELSWQEREAHIATLRAELGELRQNNSPMPSHQQAIETLVAEIRDVELAMRGIDRAMTIAAHIPAGHADPENEFRRLGQVLAGRILSEVELNENAAIIDIGCGGGRVATGLSLIAPRGTRYLGFDIRPRDINFARYFVSSENRDFQFVHLDFFNHRYNPTGGVRHLEDYFFPAPSDSFDLAIATSFFTHVDREMADRCLSETARVLKAGAQAYLTFFIYNQDYKAASKTQRQFSLEFQPGVWAGSSADVLQSVAFDSVMLLEMIAASGLTIERTLLGAWRGRRTTAVLEDAYQLSAPADVSDRQSQDVIIVRRA